MPDPILLGSDHAGFDLKEKLKKALERLGVPYEDIGTRSTDSVDYPDYAHRVAEGVEKGRFARGIVVCGTGWRQEVPFLDADLQARIMDPRGNFRLYRCILPTGVKNLAFNGYNSSFFSPLSAEMGALWIAAHLGGALSLPSEREQLDATDRRLRWMEERTEGKHARGTNIIPFSMHQIDELLADMGMTIGGMQRFMEWQMPVKPGSYARVAKDLHARIG